MSQKFQLQYAPHSQDPGTQFWKPQCQAPEESCFVVFPPTDKIEHYISDLRDYLHPGEDSWTLVSCPTVLSRILNKDQNKFKTYNLLKNKPDGYDEHRITYLNPLTFLSRKYPVLKALSFIVEPFLSWLGFHAVIYLKADNPHNVQLKRVGCTLPFESMTLTHFGTILPCCLLEDYQIGEISKDSLQNIWNSEKLKLLKDDLQKGDLRKCQKAIKTFQCQSPGTVDINAKVKRLDIRLNGKCNLECLMCDVWEGPNGRYTEENFWKEGRETLFLNIQEIMVLGGEPFVQKDTFKLIEEVTNVNKDCRWSFTTNAAWNFKGPIKNHLDKIEIEEIRVSLDSVVPSTYEKIRLKGDFDKVMKTLKELQEYSKQRERPFKMRLDFVIQKLNYLEVLKCIDFANDNSIEYLFIYCVFPLEHSIDHLEEEKRREFINFIESSPYLEESIELKKIYQIVSDRLGD